MSVKFGTLEISKSLVRDLGNVNGLHDITDEVVRLDPIPQLITSMVSPQAVYLQTKSFEHDVTTRKNLLPSDKGYGERGAMIDARPETKTHLLSVPSYGMQGHVRPRDVLRRRKPGTTDMLLAKEEVVAEEKAVMMRGWDLFREKSLAHSIVTGTTYVPNGSVPSVDFYQEYTGAARPTVNFAFTVTTVHPKVYGEEARRRILDNLAEGESVSGFVMLCGKNFWNSVTTHPQWTQAMVDRAGLQGQDPLIKRFENFSEQYQMIRYADNTLYVEAGGVLGGSVLIPDNEAYLIPLGVNLFTEYFAPAETETYVNSIAQPAYMWETSSEFDGTKLFNESNRILVPHNPLLIQKCIMS